MWWLVVMGWALCSVLYLLFSMDPQTQVFLYLGAYFKEEELKLSMVEWPAQGHSLPDLPHLLSCLLDGMLVRHGSFLSLLGSPHPCPAHGS